MTLNLEVYNEGAGTWSAVNLTTEGIANFKLQVSYSHPTRLSFVAHQPHQNTPIDPWKAIRFWDDAANDSDGNPFTDSNPTFLGIIEEVNPGDDGHTIQYTALDPTARCANQVTIMSTAWDGADDPGTGAVPRLVYNSTIDNDDDYAFCRDFNVSVGAIIQDLLDDPILRLRALLAAPAADVAYEAADLAGMDYQPQEKVVFTSEGLRSGIMRIMNDWEPAYRMLFNPGSRKWRFADITAGSTVTRTLNDFTETYPILQCRIQRSLENRYTAVKIYGPEALQNTTVTLSGGGLTDVSDGPVLETYAGGAAVRGKNKWQITDEDKRRIGRILPVPINVPSPEYRWAPNAWTQYSTWSRGPTLLARWKNNSGGSSAWQAVAGWWYDVETGIIDFKDRYVYRYNLNPEIEEGVRQPHYENPVDVKFIYPLYIDPLSVRLPASSWEGTAYTEWGMQNEMAIYDEMLAVGFLYGTYVTSATRLAKFQVLAQKILNIKKDVLHTGGLTLQGLDYTWHMLGRRLNIDGVDGDGSALTTGWESINAIVTDVEYDYEEQQTTIQFSSDQAELAGFDPAEIKEQLKIGAAQVLSFITIAVNVNKRRAYTEFGTPVIGADISISGTTTNLIADPYLGTLENPIFNG